jgi:outer membrane protein OmpA-like peptidoglycan-associated protein
MEKIRKIVLTSMLCITLSGIVQAHYQTDTLNIFFDIGKSAIDENNAKLLNKIIFDKNATSISIYGYTDFLGSVAYNQQLSRKRSSSVRNYLISKGINEKNIIISKGEGVHSNSTEENRQDPSDRGIQAHRMVLIVYNTKSQTISTKEKLSEKNLVVNSNIVLENIIFQGGSDKFLPESYTDLGILLETMQKHHTLKIEIQGHICCDYDGLDGPLKGRPLSLCRAEAVYNYLVDKGIDYNRMIPKGYGGTHKIYPLERDDYERKMNRRVEILILEK